jgi:hypothetical protein
MPIWKKTRRGKRKYLMISQPLLRLIKAYANKSNITMEQQTAYLIGLGLHYAEDASKRRSIMESFDLPHHAAFVLRRKERTYVTVPCDVYLNLKDWAIKKELKLVEATWRLLLIGVVYFECEDPRKSQRFPVVRELCETINRTIEDKIPDPVKAQHFLIDPDTVALNDVDPIRTRGKPSRRLPSTYPMKERIRLLRTENEILRECVVGAAQLVGNLQQEIARMKTKLEPIDN